jgi:nucleotide-binding universal stress UspA family protein
MNILLAADGSRFNPRAAEHLAEHLRDFGGRPTVHILHVHGTPALWPRGRRGRPGSIDKYHREESEKALAVAEKPLRKAGTSTARLPGSLARSLTRLPLARNATRPTWWL